MAPLRNCMYNSTSTNSQTTNSSCWDARPEKNARAAARYLRQLHGRFGDWRLAFAAYNAGETRVAALLKKHQARTFDEIAAYLPSETQLYVPKIEATLRKREGVTLADLKTGRG